MRVRVRDTMKKRSLLPHHVLFLLLGLSDLLRDGNSSEHWSSSLSSFMPPSFVAEAFAPPNSIPAYNKWATATTTTTTTSRHSQVTPTTPTSDLDFNGDGDEDNNDDDSSWLSFFEDQVDDSALSADSSSEDSVSALRSITFSNIRKDQEPQLLCNFLMELGNTFTGIMLPFDVPPDLSLPDKIAVQPSNKALQVARIVGTYPVSCPSRQFVFDWPIEQIEQIASLAVCL